MAQEHPFFENLRQAIQGIDTMNDTFNPEFQTEVRPNWMPNPNAQQRRLNNVFVGGPTMYNVQPAEQVVDVNHANVQELPSAPVESFSTVHVLIATYEDSKTPVDVVGVYSTREKGKKMFDLLERYRDETITFYLVEQTIQ